MSLTRADVENIAKLARLEITEEEVSGLVKGLSRIIDFVEHLSEAPVDNVTPMAHPLAMNQRLREDRVTESNQRDDFQENAPAVEALSRAPRHRLTVSPRLR